MTLEQRSSMEQSNISQEDINLILALDDKEIVKAMRRITLTQEINATVKRNKEITERNEGITERNKSVGPNEDEEELEELETYPQILDTDDSDESEEEDGDDPKKCDYFVDAPASKIIDTADEEGLILLSRAITSEWKRRLEAQTSTDVADVLNTK